MNDWLSLKALSRLLTNGLYVRNLHQHKIEQINFDVVLSCPQTFIQKHANYEVQKPAFAVTFFAAVNQNYDHKQRISKHRNTQNGSNSTIHKSQTMTFWTRYRNLLFPKTPLKMIDGSENANVSWLLNFRIRVYMKSAVIIRVSWRIELVKVNLVTRKRLSHWQTLRLRTDFDLVREAWNLYVVYKKF